MDKFSFVVVLGHTQAEGAVFCYRYTQQASTFPPTHTHTHKHLFFYNVYT